MPSAPLMPAVAPVAVPPTITTDKDAKLAALQTLPARKFLVRATAPGYAQTTYCDGPISLYYEHVVVDAEGTPQKEVVVEMERRCVCVWLSCRDARTGDMLPTAKVRLRDTRGTGAAFVFDKPGEHTVDVGRPDALGDDAVYAVEVELSGYLLWGPKTVTLTHGAVVELHVDLRATDVRVDCRDLRTMQALDDVFVTLVAGDELDARNDVLFLGVGPRRVAAVDLEKPDRIEATAPNMRQVSATRPAIFRAGDFERSWSSASGDAAPLLVRVHLEPISVPEPFPTPELPVWGWLRLGDQRRDPDEPDPEEKPVPDDKWGEATVVITVVDATVRDAPVNLRGARVVVNGAVLCAVAGKTGDGGEPLAAKIRAPPHVDKSSTVAVTARAELAGYCGADEFTASTARVHAGGSESIVVALRRTTLAVRVIRADDEHRSFLPGDVQLKVTPTHASARRPGVAPRRAPFLSDDDLFLDVLHAQATFDGTVAARRGGERGAPFVYDVVSSRPLDIGEAVACLHEHRGTYVVECSAKGFRLAGADDGNSLTKFFSGRDFAALGGHCVALPLVLPMEPSSAPLHIVACVDAVSGERVAATVAVGGATASVDAEGGGAAVDVPLPPGCAWTTVKVVATAKHWVQVGPYDAAVRADRRCEVTVKLRRAHVVVHVLSQNRKKRLKGAALRLTKFFQGSQRDDHVERRIEAAVPLAVDPGARYRLSASLRKHRQLSMTQPFTVTEQMFRDAHARGETAPLRIAVDMDVAVGAIDLVVVDVAGVPVMVSPPRVHLKAGRLRKTTVVLRRTDVAVTLRDNRTGAPVSTTRRDAPTSVRVELVPIRDDAALEAELLMGRGPRAFAPPVVFERGDDARADRFGNPKTVAVGAAYRVRVVADERLRLVAPIDPVVFDGSVFGPPKDLAPIEALMLEAARLAKRGRDPLADDELAWEMRRRLAAVLDVRVEPIVCHVVLDVVDARTNLPADDVVVSFSHAHFGTFRAGHRRGELLDVPCPGGGAAVEVDVVAEAADRVQLDPRVVTLRAGCGNPVTLYVRDADVVVHCVDADTGEALEPANLHLETAVGSPRAPPHEYLTRAVDASGRALVAPGVEYAVHAVVPRYRAVGSRTLRATTADFRHLDPHLPMQCTVRFEPCEVDLDVRVEDMATGMLLQRVHVALGPHVLGSARGVLAPLALPPGARDARWPVEAAFRGWVLCAPRTVDVAAAKVRGAPQMVTVLMRRCEVLVAAVDAFTREPLAHAAARLKPADGNDAAAPWELVHGAPGEAGFVVDVAGPRRGAVCARRDDRYDVRCDDGGEERGCAVAELRRASGEHAAAYELEDRVELRRRGQGDYTLEATCEGYRQASHCELLANDGVRPTPMTFAVQDFVRLPAREPLRLTVELEALYGHADVRVLDGAGRPLDDADVWIDRHYVGKRRGRVRLRLPGGGAPHGAKVACVCPGYVLIRPATVELRCGACVAVAVEMQRCAALVRVEDARDGAPVDARVCLVPLRSADSGHRAPPKWVQVGSKVEAVYPDSGGWYGAVVRGVHGDGTYDVDFDDGARCDGVGPWHVREPGKEVLSKPAPLKADHDFDETLDVQAQTWCDWRTMKPVGVDVQPARYRVVVHDASGDYRQVSHLAPVEIRGAELLSLDDALAAHRVPDKAKAAAPAGLFGGLFGTSKKAKETAAASGARAAALLNELRARDARSRVAVLVVKVAPRCAKATIQVLDGSGLAPLPEASVKLGRVVLGTRRGNVEVDWAKIAPGDSLAPACPWQHAAGARVTGSGVPVAVDAALDGFVHISETTVPFTASGVTRVVVTMRRATVALKTVDSVTGAALGDVAVDLQPLDGQALVSWPLGHVYDGNDGTRLAAPRVVVVGSRYRAVAQGSRLRQVSPDPAAVMTFGRHLWANGLPSDWDYELVDVEVAPGAKVLRDVAARAALEGYLQLPPRTLDIVVGDGGAPRVLRMRSLDVVVRPVSTYDRKALDDAEWRLVVEMADEDRVRLGERYVADVGCPGWRLTTSAARLVFDVGERVGEFEAHAPGDAVPFEVPMEATTALVRLASVTVANGVAGDVRDSKLSAAETPIPLLDVVAVPLPRLLHAADKVDLEITAFVPDPSLDFVSPRTVTVNPGARAADGSWPAVTDVDAVFKRFHLIVTILDEKRNELRDATWTLDGESLVAWRKVAEGHRTQPIGSGGKHHVHLDTRYRLRVSASGRSQVDFREPVEFVDGDFTKSATKDGGWECRRQIVCVPCCATVELNVLDATTRESLPQAAVEFYGARSKTKLPYRLWNSEGTAPDDAGVRTIKLDNVPGGGDEVQLAVSATLPGYTHIDPKLFELRATRADAAVVQLELLMRKYDVVADVVDPRGDELRVRGAGVELRPATLADATDDVAKRQRAAAVVTFKPADVTGQSPVPVVLGVVYDVVATHLEPPRAVQREHLFRGAWRPGPETICFREEDFHELERKASEATRKMKKNAVSDDLRYPFLKRIVERPTWRALHSWTLAARAKRRPDLRAPPYALKVRAMATHCAVDVAVLDPEGAALTKAAVRYKARGADAWSALGAPRLADLTIPNGGLPTVMAFEATLPGYLSESPTTEKTLFATYRAAQPQNAAVERVELPRTSLVAIADAGVRQHWAARGVDAPLVFTIALARAVAHVGVTVRDLAGAVLPDAALEVAGQKLRAGDHSVPAAPLVELDAGDAFERALSSCVLEGYFACSPKLPGVLAASARDHGVDTPLRLEVIMQETLVVVQLVERRRNVPIAAPLGCKFVATLTPVEEPPAELEDADPPQEFEDVRYPFLKRIVERPAWRGLHSWAAAAGAVRAPNTEPFAALSAELEARRRAERLALTRRHYPVVVTQVDEPASVVCGVRYLVAIDVVAEDGYAPPALRQVSHDSVDAAALFTEQQWLDRVPKDGCDFRVDPVPLVVKMERDANLILDARDADSDAPLPDCSVELGGVVFGTQRGMLDLDDDIETLMVSPPAVDIDGRRRTSLVVLMRRALVVVDVRDGGGDESLFERLFAAESSAKCVVALTRTDDAHKEPLRPVRPPGDGEAPVFAVEPDAAYDLEVYSKDRVTHRRALRLDGGLFLASSEPHALVVRLLRSTVRVDLSVVDAVTKAPLAGRAAVGKTDVGEARRVVLAGPRHGGPDNADDCAVALAPRRSGQAVAAFGAGPLRSVARVVEGAAYAWALTGDSGDAYALVREDAESRPRFQASDWDALERDEPLEVVVRVARKAGEAAVAVDADAPAAAVVLEVVDGDGAAVDAAEIYVGAVKLGTKRGACAVPVADGFESGGFAHADVAARCPGYALIGPKRVRLQPEREGPTTLRVVLRGARVALRVVDGSLDGDGSRMKEPLPGAWPEVRGLGSYDAALSAVDGEGFCILDPDAAYRLSVRWDALGRGPGARYRVRRATLSDDGAADPAMAGRTRLEWAAGFGDDGAVLAPGHLELWLARGRAARAAGAPHELHTPYGAERALLPLLLAREDDDASLDLPRRFRALRRAVGRAPRDADAAAAANGVVLAVPAAAFERPGDVRVDVEVEPVTCELLLEACEEATRVEIPLHACHVVAAWELRGELSAATETLERARGIFQVAAPGGGAAATLILRLDVPGYAPWEARVAGRAGRRASAVAALSEIAAAIEPAAAPADALALTNKAEPTTLVDVWDASSRALLAAGETDAATSRPSSRSCPSTSSLTAAADGWAQVTYETRARFAPRHFRRQELDRRAPLPLRVDLEPTVVDVNLVVVDAATEEDLDEALVSIHGIDVGENRGIVTLDLAELRARGAGAWVAKDGALALPLRVSARLDGFLAVEEHRWVRAGARERGTAAATCTVLLRRSEVAALCVDAASGDPVKDLISVTLIPEFGWAEDAATAAAKAAGSVHFDRVSRADVLRWIAAEKDEAEAADLFDDEFAEPRPAINAAVVAREATLRALATPSCSTRELLKALGDLAPADVPGDELRRVVDEMSTHGTRSVAVGARYAVRASHVDYVAADPAQFVRFDARGWRSIPPAQPRVVTIPVTPVFVDVAITVVDDATSSEVEDAAVSLGDERLGLTRKARLRSFFTNSIGPKDVAVALAHPRYVLLEPRTVTLAPGAGETSIACRARRATVALRPTRDGVPVDGAVCALNDVDASLPRGAGVELGAAYVVSATHDALLQIEARTLSFDEHDFRGVLDASQPLIVDVPMEERGSYFTVTCVDEVSGDDVPECEVRVGDHALGVARGPVNEVAVRRPGHKGPIRVVAVAPAYVLASAAVIATPHGARGAADATVDEFDAEVAPPCNDVQDDCLTCVYAALKPSAGADTVLELRLRPMRVVVAVTHASEPAADLSSTHIAVVARDGLRRPPANLVIERIDVEELRETPQKPPLPTAASSRSVASLGNVTFDGMHKQQKRPRFDALKCDVLLEPVDGGVDLDVCDVDVEDQGALAKLPAADVALGHHRVGAWRGRVQLIEIAGGGRPRHLDVSSRLARFVLVGFGPLSAGFAGSRAPPPLRAAHEAAVDVGMRRAMASFVARNRSDGATLTGYTTTLRVYGGTDAETVVARDGEAVAVVAGAPLAGAIAAVLDGAALLLPGDRVDAPERLYVVECHKEGYRQVSHRVEGTLEPFALPASLFAGNRSGGPVIIDVFVEKAAAELLFDVVDSDGAALEGAALEVDGVALADGARSCGVPIGAAGVSDVQVAASLAGYAQLAPAGPVRVNAAAPGPTKVAVVLERYVLHVGVLAADGAPANGATVTARFDGAGTALGAGPRRRPYVLPSRRGAYVVEAALEGSKQVDHLDPVAFESLSWFASPAAALADLAQASEDAAAFARRDRSHAPRGVARRLFFRRQGLAFYKWRLETTCLDADWDAAAPRGKHAFLVVRVAATASAVSVSVRGAVDAAAAGFARDAAGRLPSAEARFDGDHSADLLERRAGRGTALTFKLRAHPVVCRVFEPARGAHAGGAVALLEGADASGARLAGYLRFDAQGAAAGAVGRRGDAAVLPLAGRVVKGELELSAARTVDARAVLRATLGAAGDRGVDVAGAFGSWDADWDGKLARGELCHAFASLRIALDAAEVAAILALVEDDGQKSDVCALLRGGGVDASLFVRARLEHALRRLDLERGVLVEAVFAEWDANGNGLLSRKELKAGLATMGLFEGVDDADVDAVFERTRASRADGVSLPDFIAFLGWSPAAVLARRLRGVLLKAEQLGTSLDAAFAAWDDDGDGRVSPAELAAGLKGLRSFGNLLSGDGAASERVVLELVKLFDVDGDGTISVRELYRFMGRDATVVTEMRLRRVIHGSGIGAEEAFRHFAGAADEVSSADLAAGVRRLPNFEDVTEDDAAKLAALYDATGDGTTSLNEFVRQVGATADVGEAEATLLLKLRGAVNEPAAPGERPGASAAFKLACARRPAALGADALGRVFRDLGVEDAPAAMLRLLVARLSTKPTVAVDGVLAFAARRRRHAPGRRDAPREPSPHDGALRAHPDAAADKFGRLVASYEAAGLDVGAFFASLDANGNDAISPGELYAGLRRHDAFADMTRQDALRVLRHVDSSRNGAIEVGELEAFARDYKKRGEQTADVAAGPWTEAFGAARAAAALVAFADDGGALASLFSGAGALGAAALLDACRATEWPDLKVLEQRDLEAIIAQAGSDDSLDARELLAFLGTWRAYRATFAGNGSDTAETYATRAGFVVRKTAVADVRGTSAAGASDRWDLDVAWPEAADVRALGTRRRPRRWNCWSTSRGRRRARARRHGRPRLAVRLGDGGDRRCVRKWRLGAVGAFKGTAWTDASTPVTFSDAAFDAMREAARAKQEEEIHDPRADPLLAIPLEIRVGATSAVAKLDVVDDEGRRLREARVTVDGADKGLARGSLAIETEEDASGDVAVDFGAVLEGYVQLPPTRVVLEGGRETRVSLRMRRCDVHFSVVDEATGDALPAAELEIQSDGRADALRGAGVVTTAVAVDVGGDDTWLLLGPLSLDLRDVPAEPRSITIRVRRAAVVVDVVEDRAGAPAQRLVHATVTLVPVDGSSACRRATAPSGDAGRRPGSYDAARRAGHGPAWRPTSATTPPGASDHERARPGAFAVQFSGSDFDGDEPGPLVVEVAFEPVALRVTVVLVEETPTDAATFLDDVAVSLGGTAATRDRALTLPLEALAAAGGTLRLPVAALGSRHVLVGPSELVHDLEGAGVDGDHEATLQLTMRAASVEADALEAKDDGVALAKVDGATVAVAPYDAGYAGGTLLLDAGRPRPAVVELGRAYRVSARCDRMRLVSGDRFEIKPADVLALPPGGVDRETPLQSAARAYDGAAFLAVDAAGRHGELDAAHEDPVRDDPPSEYAAVTIHAASDEGRGEGQGMGVARGAVEISVPPSGAVEARAALRGWAQLPPYKFVARPDASEPAHVALVMVPALVALRAVDGATGKPLQDQAAVEAWLEPADDGDTAVRLPCCAAHGPPARVRPGARYVLKVKAPKRRLASPALVGGVLGGGAHGDELVFEDEHWWDASTKLRTAYGERPFSSKEPVVLELVAALEPSRSKLRISVVADDAPSALGAGVRVRRRGLPDLRCRPGGVAVGGLPRQVEALVDGLLPGHVQLRPRDAVTLIAGGTQDVVVQLRPASVVARCVDARSHAPLDLGRVRLAPREPSAAGLEHARGRPPVVVDVAAWRPCVVTSHVADGAAPGDPALHAVPARVGGKLVAPVYAYGVTFDDGTRDVVPAAALRGARWGVLDSRADGDGKLDWGVLATRPAEASYAVGDRVEAPRGAAQAYVAGVVASALDGGRYGIDFDGESRTDVVAGAALRPERWTATFRCYLPVGLACEARHATRGLYDVAADLPGYRQVSHLEPVLFEAKKFVALGGPREKLATPNLAPPPLQLCQTTTFCLATTPLALLRRFNDLRAARALRTWAGGARTRAARLLAPASLEGRGGASPPLEMTVKLVPCVGDLDVSVVDDATGLDLDDALVTLSPPDGDAPPHVGDWPPMVQNR
ncbi:Ca2-binding protein [Aureococcus anophagefferens]|nr:Ca2-binding protein [Aureococcus anophagefferens]